MSNPNHLKASAPSVAPHYAVHMLNGPSNPSAATYGADLKAVTAKDVRLLCERDPKQAQSVVLSNVKDIGGVDYHKPLVSAMREMVSEFGFLTPEFTAVLNSWATDFSMGVAAEKRDRAGQGTWVPEDESDHDKLLKEQSKVMQEANDNMNQTEGNTGFNHINKLGGEARKIYNKNQEATLDPRRAGDSDIRKNRMLFEQVEFYKKGLIVHSKLLVGIVESKPTTKSDLSSQLMRLLGSKNSKVAEKLAGDIADKIGDLSNITIDNIKEALEDDGHYDKNTLASVAELASYLKERKEAWSNEKEGPLLEDRRESDGRFEIYNHHEGRVEYVSKEKKVEIEADRDLTMAAQLKVLEKFELKLAEEFKHQFGDKGAFAARYGGNTYNCALYGENPHDKAREWATLLELKWLGGNYSKDVEEYGEKLPKHMYGPCGAMQMPAWILGGVLSAVHHASNLTSLWSEHSGDHYEINGLKGEKHRTTRAFVREGTELYDQFKNKFPERIIVDEKGNTKKEKVDVHTGELMSGIEVEVDCVHSQNFLYVAGSEQEMSRNLRRLWGYEREAKVKVTSMSTRYDGTDREYKQMRAEDGSSANRIVGQTKESRSPGLYDILSEEAKAKGAVPQQELTIVEGLELYMGDKGERVRELPIKENGTLDHGRSSWQCVANFTQNHDDAYKGVDQHGNELKSKHVGYEANAIANYDPDHVDHHDHGHCSDEGCHDNHGHRGNLSSTVYDRYMNESVGELDLEKAFAVAPNASEAERAEKAKAKEEAVGKIKELLRNSIKDNMAAIKSLMKSTKENLGVGQPQLITDRNNEKLKEIEEAVEGLTKAKAEHDEDGEISIEALQILADRAREVRGEFEDVVEKLELFPIAELTDLLQIADEVRDDASAGKHQEAIHDRLGKSDGFGLVEMIKEPGERGRTLNDIYNKAETGNVNLTELRREISDKKTTLLHSLELLELERKFEQLVKKIGNLNNNEFDFRLAIERLDALEPAVGKDSMVTDMVLKLKELFNIKRVEMENIGKTGLTEEKINDYLAVQLFHAMTPYKGKSKIDMGEATAENVERLQWLRRNVDTLLERNDKQSISEKINLAQYGDGDVKKGEVITGDVPQFKSKPIPKRNNGWFSNIWWSNSRHAKGVVPSGVKGIVSGSTFISSALGLVTAAGAASNLVTGLMTGFTMPFSALLGWIGVEKMRDAGNSNVKLDRANFLTGNRLNEVTEEVNKRVPRYHDMIKEGGIEDGNGKFAWIEELALGNEKIDLGSNLKGATYIANDHISRMNVALKELKTLNNKTLEKFEQPKTDSEITPSELLSKLEPLKAQLTSAKKFFDSIVAERDDIPEEAKGVIKKISDSLRTVEDKTNALHTLKKHHHAATVSMKTDRRLANHSQGIRMDKKDNQYAQATGIGYISAAMSLLSSSTITILTAATVAVGAAATIAAGAVLAPVGLGLLAGCYYINGLNKGREITRLEKMMKDCQEPFGPKVVGYHKAQLAHIENRMEELRLEQKAWYRGAKILAGMTALSVTATVVTAATGGAAAPVAAVGYAVSGLTLLGSFPLLRDTFHLFNRYGSWGGLYNRRSEDSPDINDQKIDSSEDLKKGYWSKSKMLGILLEKNGKMEEMIGNMQRELGVADIKSLGKSGHKDNIALLEGDKYNFTKGGGSSLDDIKFADREQNTRVGSYSAYGKRSGKGSFSAKKDALWASLRQRKINVLEYMRGMSKVVWERAIDANYGQRVMCDDIADHLDVKFSNAENGNKREYLIRGEAAYGMKDYTIHRINYLDHHKQQLESRVEALATTADEIAGLNEGKSTVLQLTKAQLDRTIQQIQDLQGFLKIMDEFELKTNHGKFDVEGDGDNGWQDVILHFMLATGSVNHLLQEQKASLLGGKHLVKALRGNEKLQQYLEIRDYSSSSWNPMSSYRHVSQIKVKDANALMKDKDAVNALKALLMKGLDKDGSGGVESMPTGANKDLQDEWHRRAGEAMNRRLAETLVYVLPAVESNDILAMFERFEIPSRTDIRNIEPKVRFDPFNWVKPMATKQDENYVMPGSFKSVGGDRVQPTISKYTVDALYPNTVPAPRLERGGLSNHHHEEGEHFHGELAHAGAA